MFPYEIYSNDLQRMIFSDKKMMKKLRGVFAADKLPILDFSKDCGLIANTDESNQPGQHWVAIFIPKSGVPEFFDPLAYSPNHYIEHFENFLVNRAPQYRYNAQKIQSDESSWCGLFCIYYLYFRCRNVSFENIISSFSLVLSENDPMVLSFVNEHFPLIKWHDGGREKEAEEED